MFRRFFEEGLAQSSYLIACDRTRQAAVIDPRRDVNIYLGAARTAGLHITHAIDTHTHADFVSGSRELAAAGARIVAGPGSGLGYEHLEAAHGGALQLGDIELTILHTPGHTPEHISILATAPGDPARIFTGDTLFVGAVGRPDLLGDAVMRGLAGQLYDSIYGTLLALPDDVEVWPGHGAGSLCGSGIGGAEHSTIADERDTNPLLQHQNRDAFVEAVLSDLPDTPPYFARMKRVNTEGAPVRGLAQGVAAPEAIAPSATPLDAWILDLRSAPEHAAGHPHGSISIPSAAKAGYWAAWVVPPQAPVVLLAGHAQQATEVRRQLLTVGIDTVVGWVEGGFDAWVGASLPVGHTRLVPVEELQPNAGPGPTMLDVRSAREWSRDHMPGATHLPLQQLPGRIGELSPREPIVTVCEGGARSALAAGLLERAGFTNVSNMAGGMAAWRAIERPALKR